MCRVKADNTRKMRYALCGVGYMLRMLVVKYRLPIIRTWYSVPFFPTVGVNFGRDIRHHGVAASRKKKKKADHTPHRRSSRRVWCTQQQVAIVHATGNSHGETTTKQPLSETTICATQDNNDDVFVQSASQVFFILILFL